MNRFVGGLLLMLIASSGFSQQQPEVYNQFFMNPYVYNPAYAGVEGHAVAFFTYKKQWLGISEAPTVMNANFHVPLKGGLALGGLVYNKTTGFYSQSGGKFTGGYLVSIDREHFLRFGLSLGAGNNTLNFNELDDQSSAFADIVDNETFFMGDFGFTYHFGHFNIGASLPSLFSYDLVTTESLAPLRVTPQDNMLFKMNYRGHLGDDIAIEPHILYRYSKHLPDQYEATVIFHLLHIVWVGGTYRQDAGFIGLLGLKLYEKIGLGYAYEYGNPETASLAGPSHEIHLGYHIGTRKEHAEHVSSFIKSHRKSAEERAREAELERQKKLQALRESREKAAEEVAQEEEEESLGILGETEETQEKTKPDTRWSYQKTSSPIKRVNKFGETERGIRFDRINEDGEKEVIFSWLPPPPADTKQETYELADPNEEFRIRTTQSGTKEAGIKWSRTIDNNEPETLIIWDEILSPDEANVIDNSPTDSVALSKAKILIKNTVIEKPPVVVQEEIVQTNDTSSVTQQNTEEVQKDPIITEKDPVVIRDTTIVETTERPVEEDTTTQKEETIEQPVITEDTTSSEVIDEDPVIVTEDTATTYQEEIEQKEVEKGDPELTNDFRTHEELAKSDEHLEVKRGSHMLELPAGNYVIAGVFESFDNAENYSDKLFMQGYHEAKLGYISARGYYYVVIAESDNLSSANKERDRIRKNSSLSEVWVLKVTE